VGLRWYSRQVIDFGNAVSTAAGSVCSIEAASSLQESCYHYQITHEDGVISHLIVPISRLSRVWDLAMRKHPGSPIKSLLLVRSAKPDPHHPPS